MKRALRITSGLCLLAALLLGGAGAANAVTKNVGGGTWQYGTGFSPSAITYSNYNHPSKKHGSTACKSVECVRSATVPANSWSRASLHATPGGNSSYWRV
ncbi:lactococcin 972 family bacteriocin [Clavibacter michiganensis]|uniref:lactococcin 972 family bacteriocin n=1 Tax=Clavibacter michiganensis TaxID=28447 RepID=UPI00195E20E5